MSSYDALSGPESPDYLPARSDLSALGLRQTVVRQDAPGSSVQPVPIPVIPDPPSPSVGGQTGVPLNLGWTEGFKPSRIGQQFRGETLVVPHPGPHPIYQNMGAFDRQTLEAYPSMETIASGRKRNPLSAAIADLVGGSNG